MPDSEEIILKTPLIPDGETMKFRIIKQETDEVIGYRTHLVNRISEDGKDYYKVHLKTESIDGEVTEETSFMEMAEILKPISRHTITKREDGKMRSDVKINYEGMDMPSNCCASPGAMSLYLRGGPFDPKSKVSLNIIMMDRTFKLNATTAKGKETITVPAGTFECYKVEWTPDIGSLMDQLPAGFNFPQAFYSLAERLASRFIPSVFYWYSTKAPHCPIRYEGVEPSSFSTGEPIIEELIGIE
ncbi:MAG: hypothetical protein SVM80_08725 [Halobacteriota archaeon]|nr:hypothetical protein [Halobacteriota archaeon]